MCRNLQDCRLLLFGKLKWKFTLLSKDCTISLELLCSVVAEVHLEHCFVANFKRTIMNF